MVSTAKPSRAEYQRAYRARKAAERAAAEPHVCEHCRRTFTPERSDARFCSDSCRANSWRWVNEERLEARRCAVADAIAYRTDGDAMVYQRDVEQLITGDIWERARGDVDLLAAIWCARDGFRTLEAAADYYLPKRTQHHLGLRP